MEAVAAAVVDSLRTAIAAPGGSPDSFGGGGGASDTIRGAAPPVP